MGRIKTKPIKRLTREFYKLHSEKLNEDYVHNKKVLSDFSEIKSKKIRNSIAGYATRLVKAQKQER